MRPLTAGLALVAVAAVPASAARPTPPTQCVAVVHPADEDGRAGCDTLGTVHLPLGGFDDARTLRLTVLTGTATATLTCNDGSAPVTVVLDGTGTGAKTLFGGGYCWVDLYATSAGTTAVATNTSAYVVS
jgi:hypothetical protein